MPIKLLDDASVLSEARTRERVRVTTMLRALSIKALATECLEATQDQQRHDLQISSISSIVTTLRVPAGVENTTAIYSVPSRLAPAPKKLDAQTVDLDDFPSDSPLSVFPHSRAHFDAKMTRRVTV